MNVEQRTKFLKIGAVASIGLLVLNAIVIEPALTAWKDQSDRLAKLKKQVTLGRQLLEREPSLRQRWQSMTSTDLAENTAEAENDLFKAVGQWARDGRITFTSLNPQWRTYDLEGYATIECRATATGDQAGIARFLYELENSSQPARIESAELLSTDKNGDKISVSLRFTAVRILQPGA
ncbi:MAG: hypothetical protein ACO34E_03605 [Limisphaerales bacterium]